MVSRIPKFHILNELKRSVFIIIISVQWTSGTVWTVAPAGCTLNNQGCIVNRLVKRYAQSRFVTHG